MINLKISSCIDDVKMGIINDGKEPYSVDYTACALGIKSGKSNPCDDGRKDLNKLSEEVL